MRSHARSSVFFLCMTALSAVMGALIHDRLYIVTFLCFAWAVYHAYKWLSGAPSRKEPEVFDQFYGGPDGSAGRTTKKSQEKPE